MKLGSWNKGKKKPKKQQKMCIHNTPYKKNIQNIKEKLKPTMNIPQVRAETLRESLM